MYTGRWGRLVFCLIVGTHLVAIAGNISLLASDGLDLFPILRSIFFYCLLGIHVHTYYVSTTEESPRKKFIKDYNSIPAFFTKLLVIWPVMFFYSKNGPQNCISCDAIFYPYFKWQNTHRYSTECLLNFIKQESAAYLEELHNLSVIEIDDSQEDISWF